MYAGHGMPCSTVCGVGMFQKKVILYGSEGNVRVFSSEFRDNSCDPQDMPGRNAPRCTVQVADPVILSARLIEPCDRCKCDCCCCGCCCNIPECICNRYGGGFCDDEDNKIVLVTLGIFTIVQLVRNVQMLVPVYDYCMPCKECCPTTDNPATSSRKCASRSTSSSRPQRTAAAAAAKRNSPVYPGKARQKPGLSLCLR